MKQGTLRKPSGDATCRTAARRLAAAALLAAVPGLGWAAEQRLTVATWGGIYTEASRKAFFEPFTAETGIEIRTDQYGGGLSDIRAQVESGNIFWDVVDFEFADLVLGCEESLLELVDVGSLPPAPDGLPAKDDYEEGTLSDCGGGGLYWSTYYAYNSEAFPDGGPTTLEDFFDLAKFPGRRGMRRIPYTNLEFALMADGVPPEEVYAVLAAREGVDRAFAKLDSIKEHIVWWDVAAQPLQMLAAQEVVMTTSWNARVFQARFVDKQPFVGVWNGQVLENGQFGIIAGTPQLEAAQKFLRFASRPDRMAAMSGHVPYSPTRRSANELVTTHLETGLEIWPHMPNYPVNKQRSLRSDSFWWRDNLEEMIDRFNAWLLH